MSAEASDVPGKLPASAGLLENLAALYGVQSCNYILPLISIPYLARVLGPEAWGLVALAQSIGAYVSLAIEYGFELSATRKIAQCRNDRRQMADIAAGVFGSKVLFSTGVIIPGILIFAFSGITGPTALLWGSALLWGLSGGWTSLWYFQGIQRVRQAGLLDISARVLATAGLFLLVHSPRDNWKVLTINGCMSFFSNACAAVLVYRQIPFILPTRETVRQAIREGWAMFLFKSSAIAMLSSNTFLLGLFAPLERVGWYAAAEKISRACWQLLSPLSQALYPRFSGLVHAQGDRSRRMAAMFTGLTTAIGLSLGVVLFWAAPIVVGTLMGRAFLPAIPVLRILALLGPVVALNSALAFYWLFPVGLEKPYTRLVIAAMLADATLNAALAGPFGEMGTATAVAAAELVMLSGALVLVWVRRKADWGPRDNTRTAMREPSDYGLPTFNEEM